MVHLTQQQAALCRLALIAYTRTDEHGQIGFDCAALANELAGRMR